MAQSVNRIATARIWVFAIPKLGNAIANQAGLDQFVQTDVLSDITEKIARKSAIAIMLRLVTISQESVNVFLAL